MEGTQPEFDNDLTKVGISKDREEVYSLLLKRYLDYISKLSNDDLALMVEQDCMTLADALLKKDLTLT